MEKKRFLDKDKHVPKPCGMRPEPSHGAEGLCTRGVVPQNGGRELGHLLGVSGCEPQKSALLYMSEYGKLVRVFFYFFFFFSITL